MFRIFSIRKMRFATEIIAKIFFTNIAKVLNIIFTGLYTVSVKKNSRTFEDEYVKVYFILDLYFNQNALYLY